MQEVLDLEGHQIEPTPHIGTKLNTEVLKGMGTHNGRFIMILDIDKVFSASDVEPVQGAEGMAA